MMKKQQGISIIGFILLLVLLGAIGAAGMKIAPIYLEYYKVETAMTNVLKEGGRSSMEMKKAILRRLEIDDVESVTSKNLKVTQRQGKTIITVKYAVRRNFIGNMDIIVSFNKTVK